MSNSPSSLQLPTGLKSTIKLLTSTAEGEQTYYKRSLVIAENVSKENFKMIEAANPEVRDLWYDKGRILYSEFTKLKIHNGVCNFFSSGVLDNNKTNRQYKLVIESDVSAEFGNSLKAPDVSLIFKPREVGNIKSPNIVGEIGYSSDLEELYQLVDVYLAPAEADEDANDILGYFIVKFTYPYSLANPKLFQMLFLYFEHNNDPITRPSKVISCGTLPVSQDVINVLGELTNLNPLDAGNSDIFLGHGFGGPPCDHANRMNPIYSFRFPGEVMVSMDRAGNTLEDLDDPALYNFDFNLFDLQQVAENHIAMNC